MLAKTLIALDITGALDKVWQKGIVAKLNSLGIDGNILCRLRTNSMKEHRVY